ncbi:L,D-transpeptidase [Corynebacterium accolens]|uniref:L,D-transpeptidase n=1 Tax=Corynebacterium accolens TaxID=38284 RepID=UPI0025435D1B|nr:Ig-like domain-containing protein [Corynebacterium accolens]MDK4309191.1 Ig-like domain-containing protein [Corynebacterium accolens]
MINSLSNSRRIAAASIACISLVVASCSVDSAAENRPEDKETTSSSAEKSEQKEKSKLSASVKDGAEDVDPSKPVTVESTTQLKSVTMTNELGVEVEEKLSEDGKKWTTAEDLGYNHTYSIVASDKDGNKKNLSFSTSQAAGVAQVAMTPIPGSEVGVGQVIGVNFGTYITDRKAAEDTITVKTNPEVEGAFYWVNNQEVRWRPKEYWEPGTKVEVKVDQYGKDLGGGIYGGENTGTDFTIGDRTVALVDNATKTMKVYKNKELLRTIPVSLGRDYQYDTPNGRYVIGDQHQSLLMDSETFGLPHDAGGYSTEVDWATQMSYSGIYVHSAPWSVWAQGNSNTSHGCINVTPEAAQWFQNTVKRGDIVRVFNTYGETLNPMDGLGDWNLSWEEWSKGNADANQ